MIRRYALFLSYIGQDLYEDLNKLGGKTEGLIDGAISCGKNPRLLSESVEKLRRMDQINRELLNNTPRRRCNPLPSMRKRPS